MTNWQLGNILFIYDCLVFLNAVQSANRQLWVVVNYLLTIVGAFTFGYFVGHFASFDIPGVSWFWNIFSNLIPKLPPKAQIPFGMGLT